MLAEQARIKAELQRMEDSEESTEETDGDLRDTMIKRYKDLDELSKPIISRMEEIRGITRAAADPANLERPEDGSHGAYAGGSPDLVIRTKRDPFENPEMVADRLISRSEMVSRALDAIELSNKRDLPHDHAETATERVQHRPDIARHVLLTGSEQYQEAFRHYLETGDNHYAHSSPELSRALTLATGSAGFALPFVLDPTLVIGNSGSANPFRRISRVEQTTSNTWNGVNTAGVNAAMLGEAAASTDNTPVLGQIQATPQKAVAWVFGSYESLDDVNFSQQLPELFADAKDRLEEQNFATGAGTGVFPLGSVTAGTTGNTIAATAFAVGDVYGLQARLGARFRGSAQCAWVGNLFYLNKTRQFDAYGGSSFWANLGADMPEQLLGKPVYESTSMSSATASGTKAMIFADWKQYVIVDRVGMNILYDPMIKTASTANLPSGQAGWYAFWRYGAAVSTATALQVLTIQ